jgi:GntR family transcriptional repressor for pyruvate dehydrogenase complex
MTRTTFEPLRLRRLSEVIEESIKDLILTGELKPGSRLPTEKIISQQFGVSTVTVREALRGLEAFGIIQKKRGKDGGIFVAQAERSFVDNVMYNFLSIRKPSANDINQVRVIIEPATARIAATTITADELKELENNIRSCEIKIKKKKGSFSAKDFIDIEERNVEFHKLIAESTHNAILALTVSYINDFLLSYKKRSLSPDINFTSKTVKAHRSIYAAVRNADAQIAERAMLLHMQTVGDYLLEHEKLKKQLIKK